MIRPSLIGLSLLVLVTSTSCVADLGGVAATTRLRERLTTLPLGGGQADDRYVAFRGKKKNKDGFQVWGLPRELWAPFRVEWKAGAMDVNKPDLGASFFCMQLRNREAVPAFTVALCGAKGTVDGSITAFATSSTGNFGTPHEFANTKVVEFAFDADGTDLKLFARAEGDVSYVEIGSRPFVDQMVPLVPSISASLLRKKNVVGFDSIRVVSNGTALVKATDEQLAARAIYEAADPIIEGLYALDGTDPETAIVDANIDTTSALIDDVLVTLGGLSGQPALDSAAKLGTAKAKLAKAKAAIANDKSAAKIGDKLGAAINAMFEAAVTIDPAE